MAKDDMIELEGTVVESLPNTMFSVDIGGGHTIREAEDELHPHIARGQGHGSDEPLRPDPRQDNLEIEVRNAEAFSAKPNRRSLNESQTFGKAHVREVQDHKAPWQGHGDLREPEAQAASGLRP